MPAEFQAVLSIFLLGLAIRLHIRTPGKHLFALLLFVYAILTLLLIGIYFVSDSFTASGINEAVLYHLRYGLDGAGFSEYATLAITTASLFLVIAAALVWLLFLRRTQPHRIIVPASPRHLPLTIWLSLIGSLMANPATADLYQLLAPAYLTASLGAADIAKREQAVLAEFNEYYSQETPKTITPSAPNLVFIYAESLERTYLNQNIFPGLMNNLRALEKDAISYTGLGQVYGTSWTIAGIVASQCGIPLFTPSHGNSMTGLNSFLPSAYCLGDLLKRDGYHLAYLGGAQLQFAGKGDFLRTHHFDELSGRQELLPKLANPTYLNGWGLYDDSLLDLVYDRYASLSESGTRFGLFTLTLDTHHPNGHLSGSCTGLRYRDGNNALLNAVHCADRLLGRFITRIRNSPGGRNTVIVLASDHLAMKNQAHDLLESLPRKNLLMVWPPDRPGRKVPAAGSTLDIATTLLPYLGYQGRLGLGYNLDDQDAQVRLKADQVRTKLSGWTSALARFWDFPRLKHHFEIDADSRRIDMDGQKFKLPVIIELNAELQTMVKFPYGGAIAELVGQTTDDKGFLLVADCHTGNPEFPHDGVCLFAGRGGKFRNQMLVRSKTRLPPEAIRRMTGLSS